MRLHRSRILRKRATMLKAIANRKEQGSSDQCVTCTTQLPPPPPPPQHSDKDCVS